MGTAMAQGFTCPMEGLPPAPSPRVSFSPICSLWLALIGEVCRACKDREHTQASGHQICFSLSKGMSNDR